MTVVPPLALHTGDVAAEVDVVRQLAQGRRGRGPRRDLARAGELVDVTWTAVGALEQEGHLSRNSQLHPVLWDTRWVPRTGQPSRERVGSASRAFAVLDLLADAGPLGTNEIARRTGATPSTVSRHLGTLVEAGLVEHDAATGRYRLGLRLVHLASAVLARLDVRALAHPHLEALVAETGETTTLSVPAEPDAITVDFVASPHYVHGVTSLGRPSVAHATAAGKAMLAFSGRHPTTRSEEHTSELQSLRQ